MLWITKLPKSPRPAPAPSATSFSLGLQDAGQFGVATGRRGFNRTSFNKSTSAPFVAVFISCRRIDQLNSPLCAATLIHLAWPGAVRTRSEEHTSELKSRGMLL